MGKGKGLIDFRRGCGRSSLGARLDTGMRMRYVALINGNETYDPIWNAVDRLSSKDAANALEEPLNCGGFSNLFRRIEFT
ncbi:unnamed protein product [Danaus chrysippus]|uniref:(African queen) hypothetical protein n=1 Tax=Danaus chrysippus TaxID=151541 RepID=A0A8J2MHK0_9NEOP|nr:unnamed protein product [Danaus chrysippus]